MKAKSIKGKSPSAIEVTLAESKKDGYHPTLALVVLTYILNGPTFIIEFDNNGGPRNSANHIHAIWREKGNEYGEDILKQHYLKEKH